MTDKQGKGAEMPWLALAYIVFVVVFAFGGISICSFAAPGGY
ncbi:MULTISPECIES: hypothetical protein [Cupriavidus]